MKDCMEAQTDQYADFLNDFDCGSTEAMAPTDLPSECDVVKEKCPDMFN